MNTETTEQTEQSTEEQAKATKDAEAGFAAGFAKVRPTEDEAGVRTEVTDKAPEKSDAEKEAEEKARVDAEAKAKTEADAKVKADAEQKAYEALPEKVRKTLESVDSLAGTVNKLAGNLGGVTKATARIESALKEAKNATEKGGGAAPSDSQIKAALANPDAWKKLEEDFPDFAGPMKAELSSLRAELAKKAGGEVDMGKVSQEVVKSITPQLDASERRAREFAQVDIKHDGWEDTVKTAEFQGWLYAGGPTKEEREAAAKAGSLDSISTKYPQWWGERGALSYSDRGRDAIKLLDTYKSANDTAAKAEADRIKKEKRLEGAVTPKGTSSPPTTGISDDDAFNKGFKKVAGVKK